MTRSTPVKIALALAAATLAITHRESRADDSYIGHDANWSDPTAWTNSAPPVSTDNVFVLPSDPGTNTLSLDTTATISNLFLGATGNGTTILNLQNNSLTSNSINLQSSALITGAGALQAQINNAGAITTTANTTLNLTAVSNNSGTISAISAGDLQLHGAYTNAQFDNTGGALSASGDPLNSAFLDISNLTITKGNLTATAPNSTIRVTATSTLSDVTINGNLQNSAQLALQNVTLASGNFTQGALLLLSGTITNNATWNCNSSINSNATITGNGTINLNGATWFFGGAIGAGQTIQGSGSFPPSGVFTNNGGNFIANSPNACLSIAAPTIYNTGTFSAVNGASLEISGPSYAVVNYNGTISATGGNATNPSTVDIGFYTVLGGQLNTDATGRIRLLNAGVTLTDVQTNGNLFITSSANAYLNNDTFNGQVTQSAPTFLTGTITNNANWTSNSTIQLNGDVSFAGTGTITLSNASITTGSAYAATIGPAQTIAGSGNIAVSSLINAGTIVANTPQSLAISLSGGNLSIPAFTNSGTVAAANASIHINGGLATATLLYNSNGSFSASGANGSIVLSNLTLSGGQLSTDTTARIYLNAVALLNLSATGNFIANSSVSLQNVTLSGSLQSSSAATLSGVIVNNGNIAFSAITAVAPTTLNGNGTTIISGTVAGSSNASLTIGANQTLVGSLGTTLPVTNFGTILANASLSSVSSTAFVNAGMLSASAGGDLELNANATFTNYGGTISASGVFAGSTPPSIVNISGYTVVGGQLSTDSVASIHLLSNASLNSVQSSGNLFLNTTSNLTNVSFSGNVTQTSSLTLVGTIANNANWTSTNNTTTTISGFVSLTGNGTLTLAGGNFASPGFPSSLTIGTSQNLRGYGSFSANSNLSLFNNGSIIANVPGANLSLSTTSAGNVTNAALINTGTLGAINGGVLNLNGAFQEDYLVNTGGSISITGSAPGGSPSIANIANITIHGGTISTDSLGIINAVSSSFENVQASGNFVFSGANLSYSAISGNVTQSGFLTINGTLTNNAFWTASGNGTLNGPQVTLAGNGTFALIGGNFATNFGNVTLTIPASQTIKGFGSIGSPNPYNLTLFNTGQITATPTPTGGTPVFSPLKLTFSSGSISLNSGNISAISGGTLNLFSNNTNYITPFDNSNGSIFASGSANGTLSHISITNIAITGGTLSTDASDQIQFNSNSTLADLSAAGNFLVANGTLILRNVSLSGTLSQNANATIALTGTLTNNANWTQSGIANITVAGAQTLQGTGSLALNGGAIAMATSAGSPNFSLLTNAAGHTIQGSGFIGQNNMAALINNGILDANTPGNVLAITAPLINAGTIAVEHGAALNVRSSFTSTGATRVDGTLILEIIDSTTLPTTLSQLLAGVSSNHTTGLFTSTPSLALALIDNSSLAIPYTTFAGQPVDPNALLLTPAFPGDVNLDNHVDLTDLSTLLSNFGQSTPNWTSGNFDHQPTIDLTDLADVLNNFGLTNPNANSVLSTQSSALPLPTPEPTSLTLLALTAPLLLKRRPRPQF